MSSVEIFQLTSGRECHMVSPRGPLGIPYSVLVFNRGQPDPTEAEQAEMLGLALKLARRLSTNRFGAPEQYMLIHNGLGARRRRDFHYHVIPVAGRVEKILVYFWLFLKNLFHPLWLVTRPLRHVLTRPPG